MVIGILKIELWLPASNSLKGKRMVLKSIKDRLRASFNISIAEVDYHDKWQRAGLAVAAVAPDRRRVDRLLQHVLKKIEDERRSELGDHQIEII